MKPSPVRELARRYTEGELSLEEYRTRRRHMIDAVCAGTLRIEYGEANPRRVKTSKPRWLLVIPVIIVIGIGIAMALRFSTPRHTHAEQTTAPQTAAASGTQLVHTFTDSNDWSENSVSTFLQHWQKLPVREKLAARNSYLFPRLLAQLHEQILSQQAMLELAPNPKAARRHLAKLQTLADTLKNSRSN